LSKIAGRAYGDVYQFDKIAKANNITDPNNIEVGTVLKIPR
jgi:nucleoid-associated protein YgaU